MSGQNVFPYFDPGSSNLLDKAVLLIGNEAKSEVNHH